MKTKSEALEEIAEIRSLMEQSTRFLSLSGLSGILSGSYALVAALYVYLMYYTEQSGSWMRYVSMEGPKKTPLLLTGITTLVLALTTMLGLSYRNANKKGIQFWSASSQRMLQSLSVPLLTGGLFCLILLYRGDGILVAPATLIFYGLALVNASKHTVKDVHSLGMIQIALGLMATFFAGHGLLFWSLGFGVMHIIYGTVMYLKYERAQ
ncbi:hypothetical protein [Algivirga pacifica]|uniref:Uncharacterized protein n=1 Tax=Algivirga pacifica TaxID=1162670 RepID=A0ABP9D4F2_9BACT